MMDFSICTDLRKLCKTIYIIVDNTWLIHPVFNPLMVGVDFVVISLTKYYSGGTAICGAILGNDLNIMHHVEDYQRFNGIHVSPVNARCVLHGLETIE